MDNISELSQMVRGYAGSRVRVAVGFGHAEVNARTPSTTA